MSGDLKALKTVAELDANILDLEAQRSNIPKLIEAKKSSLAHTQAELQKKDAELKGLVAKTALKEGDSVQIIGGQE